MDQHCTKSNSRRTSVLYVLAEVQRVSVAVQYLRAVRIWGFLSLLTSSTLALHTHRNRSVTSWPSRDLLTRNHGDQSLSVRTSTYITRFHVFTCFWFARYQLNWRKTCFVRGGNNIELIFDIKVLYICIFLVLHAEEEIDNSFTACWSVTLWLSLLHVCETNSWSVITIYGLYILGLYLVKKTERVEKRFTAERLHDFSVLSFLLRKTESFHYRLSCTTLAEIRSCCFLQCYSRQHRCRRVTIWYRWSQCNRPTYSSHCSFLNNQPLANAILIAPGSPPWSLKYKTYDFHALLWMWRGTYSTRVCISPMSSSSIATSWHHSLLHTTFYYCFYFFCTLSCVLSSPFV